MTLPFSVAVLPYFRTLTVSTEPSVGLFVFYRSETMVGHCFCETVGFL